MNVTFIGANCASLRHLALSKCTFAPVSKHHHNLFQNLDNLEIWSGPNVAVGPSVVRQLMLNSRRMTKCLFQSVASLCDSLLLDIWDKNQMLDLTNVVFDRCHGITVRMQLAVKIEIESSNLWIEHGIGLNMLKPQF